MRATSRTRACSPYPRRARPWTLCGSTSSTPFSAPRPWPLTADAISTFATRARQGKRASTTRAAPCSWSPPRVSSSSPWPSRRWPTPRLLPSRLRPPVHAPALTPRTARRRQFSTLRRWQPTACCGMCGGPWTFSWAPSSTSSRVAPAPAPWPATRRETSSSHISTSPRRDWSRRAAFPNFRPGGSWWVNSGCPLRRSPDLLSRARRSM
mmetsp:Transcript_26988/g.79538  ORF Transcript_26988/g.79538 Transcript_26988/m.79538 type:complete len:209 (-) Transcript_26988:595-1221(-)